MKIGIDFDDVLSKTTEGFIEFHNKNYGTNLDIKTKEKSKKNKIIIEREVKKDGNIVEFNRKDWRIIKESSS